MFCACAPRKMRKGGMFVSRKILLACGGGFYLFSHLTASITCFFFFCVLFVVLEKQLPFFIVRGAGEEK